MGSIFACGKHCCFVPSTNASFAERSEQAIIAKDLFNGTEEFCRSYFEDEYPYTWEIAGNYMVNNLWEQTKVKNHILAMCRRLGWNYKEETGMKTHWHKHHLQWLSAKINKTQIPAKKVSFKILLKQYEDVTKNIDLFDTEVMHVSQTPKYEKVKALTSFKGVKENTALTIISELGDIRRFDHPLCWI